MPTGATQTQRQYRKQKRKRKQKLLTVTKNIFYSDTQLNTLRINRVTFVHFYFKVMLKFV